LSFSSLIFVFVFLPLVLSGYFILRGKWRNTLLLVSSLLFYFWGEGPYVFVLIISILNVFIFSVYIQKEKDKNNTYKHKKLLVVALIFNLALLFTFKYSNFAIANLNLILSWWGFARIREINMHLPLGISFFTFQGISYLIDIYRGELKASKNLVRFTVYRSLFPLVTAGPIVRYKDVAKQLIERVITPDSFSDGIIRFITGLGKKVLIANALAPVADEIFSLRGNEISIGTAWLGIVCYTLQIYFDFSGYSDMAIGLGKMFGFTFLENFNYPYISKSIREFWRRWHISLSLWIRDYLYIPLGGSKYGWARTSLNILIVFFLCGLWHGANWTFAIWGLWYGLFLVIEHTILGEWLGLISRPFRHLYVLLVVMTGWVFFRSESINSALVFLKAMYGFENNELFSCLKYIDTQLIIVLVAGLIGCTPFIKCFSRIKESNSLNISKPMLYAYINGYELVKMFLLAFIFLFSAMSLFGVTHKPFIYFRF
jgi:alginate O-acetyltransferase complex protein AlgI